MTRAAEGAVRHYLIVETGSTGHLLVFVRILALQAVAEGHAVTVALRSDVLGTPEYHLHLAPHADRIAVVAWDKGVSAASLAELARQRSSTDVVIPHADPYVGIIALARRGGSPPQLHLMVVRDPRWESPAPLPRRVKNLVKLLSARLAMRRKAMRVVWLREPGYARTGREFGAVDPFIPDGTFDEIRARAASTRAVLDERAPVFWVGVTGALSAHKNVALVVDAIVQAARLRPDLALGLAVIGPSSPSTGIDAAEVRSLCASARVATFIDDRLLTNFEMNATVGALDAVVMAYSTHSPNSTLGKAYVLGTRVVGAGAPSIRRFVASLGGWESDLSSDAIARNILAAYHAPAPAPHEGELSPSEFARSVLGLVPPAPPSTEQGEDV